MQSTENTEERPVGGQNASDKWRHPITGETREQMHAKRTKYTPQISAYHCTQCGGQMNPVDLVMGPVLREMLPGESSQGNRQVSNKTKGHREMTKKHFIALADALRDNNAMLSDRQINILADFCASQNPQFNRNRWTSYLISECGPNGGVIKQG